MFNCLLLPALCLLMHLAGAINLHSSRHIFHFRYAATVFGIRSITRYSIVVHSRLILQSLYRRAQYSTHARLGTAEERGGLSDLWHHRFEVGVTILELSDIVLLWNVSRVSTTQSRGDSSVTWHARSDLDQILFYGLQIGFVDVLHLYQVMHSRTILHFWSRFTQKGSWWFSFRLVFTTVLLHHLFWILVLTTSTPDSMLQKIAVNDDWCLEFVFPFDGNWGHVPAEQKDEIEKNSILCHG